MQDGDDDDVEDEHAHNGQLQAVVLDERAPQLFRGRRGLTAAARVDHAQLVLATRVVVALQRVAAGLCRTGGKR